MMHAAEFVNHSHINMLWVGITHMPMRDLRKARLAISHCTCKGQHLVSMCSYPCFCWERSNVGQNRSVDIPWCWQAAEARQKQTFTQGVNGFLYHEWSQRTTD